MEQNYLFVGIEMHACYLIGTVLLFIHMFRSFKRNGRKREYSLVAVYICAALMLISDCVWTCISIRGNAGTFARYLVNIIYFVSSSAAAAHWFIYCAKFLEIKLLKSRRIKSLFLIPFFIMLVFYLTSPWWKLIFSIDEEGEYVRGSLFILDPLVKLGYIGMGSVMALLKGRTEKAEYLRKSDFSLILFGVPVFVFGILQSVTGADFNCLGVTAALLLIFLTGITNPDSENTDAIYALANSFEASYIVNLDTGLMRPLRQDLMHDKSLPGMASKNFETHFTEVLSDILLPEDKMDTLDAFRLKSVAKRFELDPSFSIRYRVQEESGRTYLRTAFFIHASGNEKKKEFLLGITTIHAESLYYERNEILKKQNQQLEQINANIIETVAKIVEARDHGSGDHIVRVKRIVEILAKEIQADYPEYGLDDEKVRIISSASVLHDIGKIYIPDAVLLKPGRLNDEEFAIMKTHSEKGCDALNMFPMGMDDAFFECALEICRWHHEKYDGKGYPDGLRGEDIPISAQIVSVADCFDALVSDRPYKKAFTPEKAVEMIMNGECGAFSSKILHALEVQQGKLAGLARLYK